MAAYQERLDEIEARGIQLVGLSVDRPTISAELKGELGLTFRILSDHERQVVKDWDRFNRYEMGGIAKPAVFVIDSDMTVRLRSDETMMARYNVDDLIEFLDSGAELADLDKPAKRKLIIPSPKTLLAAVPRFLSRLFRWDV